MALSKLSNSSNVTAILKQPEQNVDIHSYFTQKQLDAMGPYEQKRYENLAKNFFAMQALGISI